MRVRLTQDFGTKLDGSVLLEKGTELKVITVAKNGVFVANPNRGRHQFYLLSDEYEVIESEENKA